MAPHQPKRPWLVRARVKSYRTGRWNHWYTHASYSAEEFAKTSAANLIASWGKTECEAYVRHRDSLLPVRMDDNKHADAASRARAGEA